MSYLYVLLLIIICVANNIIGFKHSDWLAKIWFKCQDIRLKSPTNIFHISFSYILLLCSLTTEIKEANRN